MAVIRYIYIYIPNMFSKKTKFIKIFNFLISDKNFEGVKALYWDYFFRNQIIFVCIVGKKSKNMDKEKVDSK